MKAGSRAFFRLTKPFVFAACLAPFAYLALAAFGMAGLGLGANPVEKLLHELGRWGLKFLLLSTLLAVIGLTSVLIWAPYWSEHLHFGIGLLIALVTREGGEVVNSADLR